MITLSRIYKAVLIIVSMYMLEYLDIVLPSGNTDMFRVIIGGIAVTLAIMTLIIPKKSPEFKNQIRFANRFFIIYIPIVLLTSVVSVIWYGYKFMSTLAIVMPYFFPLFAYPLIYIFYRDKTHKKFLKKSSYWSLLSCVSKQSHGICIITAASFCLKSCCSSTLKNGSETVCCAWTSAICSAFLCAFCCVSSLWSISERQSYPQWE